jgi:hypothetical protein
MILYTKIKINIEILLFYEFDEVLYEQKPFFKHYVENIIMNYLMKKEIIILNYISWIILILMKLMI